MANDDETSFVSVASRKRRDVDDRLLRGKRLINAVRAGEGQQSGCTPASCIARAAPRVTSYIRIEKQWRKVDCSVGSVKEPGSRVLAFCWKRDETALQEVTSETWQDIRTLAVIPKLKRMIFRHAELTLFGGCATDGIRQAAGLRRRVCATFHSQCGMLHVNLSRTCLRECYRGTFKREDDDGILVHDAGPVCDVTIARLGVARAHADGTRAAFGRLCFDSVDLAIVFRILAREFVKGVWTRPKTSVPALQSWKVRRVIEYIDANISEPIRLADIAVPRQVSPHTNSFAQPKSNGRRHSRSTRIKGRPISHRASASSRSPNFTTVCKRLVG
jgi:hypothetical protein